MKVAQTKNLTCLHILRSWNERVTVIWNLQQLKLWNRKVLF